MKEFTNWHVLGQASLLSVSTTTGDEGQEQATSTGIEKPQLIFSGNS
jgi:hypothetical protein